jgi:hypothetical protein
MLARHIGKQLLGTVVAVLGGWLAALVFLELDAVVQLLQQPHYIVPEALVVGPITATWFASYFIVPVWLFLLIPLYLFVPPSSVLWRWHVCTICGVIAGLVIVGCVFRGIPGVGSFSVESWSFFVMAAITGGVTCLIGALTRERFTNASNQSMQPTAGRFGA